jgi:hypothetical protein
MEVRKEPTYTLKKIFFLCFIYVLCQIAALLYGYGVKTNWSFHESDPFDFCQEIKNKMYPVK